MGVVLLVAKGHSVKCKRWLGQVQLLRERAIKGVPWAKSQVCLKVCHIQAQSQTLISSPPDLDEDFPCSEFKRGNCLISRILKAFDRSGVLCESLYGFVLL